MENKALGKGLSALIPGRSENISEGSVAYIKVGLIRDNSLQPRTNYDQGRIEELKASIREKGVLQPILVREKQGSYEVIAGERRLRAARALNLAEIPAIIKSVNDQEALVIALIENIQREELNPIEEADAYQKLIGEFGYTQEAVAQAVGKDRSTVTNLLRLLKLPEQIRKSISDGEITTGHARALLSVENTATQKHFYSLVIKKGLSVRELENLVKNENKGGARRGKTAKSKDPQVVALEEGLQKYLGTKVRIEYQKKRGKIIIDYYSVEDLDRVIKVIIKS